MDNIEYYNNNADKFIAESRHLELTEYYDEFLRYVPEGGHILDAACGTGRDALAFINRGFQITAYEASVELVKSASDFTGHNVLEMTFDQMTWVDEFDGIWSSACLLHVPFDKIDQIVETFIKALKPGGIWYISVKEGTGHQEDENGRTFYYYTQESLSKLINKHNSVEIVRVWNSTHSKVHNIWVNALVRKIRPSEKE